MPRIDLGFNDKTSMSNNKNNITIGVDFENVKLHKCVDLKTFQRTNSIKFTPPDGKFILMNYKIKTTVKPLFILQIININESPTKREFKMEVRTDFKPSSVANDVEVWIPAACDLYDPIINPTKGVAKYSPDKDCFVWRIPVFKGLESHSIEYKYSLPTLVSRNNHLL